VKVRELGAISEAESKGVELRVVIEKDERISLGVGNPAWSVVDR
jgi:hypothetical protein